MLIHLMFDMIFGVYPCVRYPTWPRYFLFKVDGRGGYLGIYEAINPRYPFDTENGDAQMVDYSPASDIMKTDNDYDDQED